MEKDNLIYCKTCGNTIASESGSCLSCGNTTFITKEEYHSLAKPVVPSATPVVTKAPDSSNAKISKMSEEEEEKELSRLKRQLEIEKLKKELNDLKTPAPLQSHSVNMPRGQKGQVIINNVIQSSHGPGNVIPGPENCSHCSRTTYQLLALFLGGFGVHEFYRGYSANGVLAFLFSWTGVPSVVAIVQIFTEQRDSHGRYMR